MPRSSGALPLSPLQANVAEFRPRTLAADELRKRRWRPPLLHESDSLLRAARPAAHWPLGREGEVIRERSRDRAGDRSERLLRANSPRPAPRCMQESHNPCSVCTGAESKVAADRVDDRAEDNARAGTRSQPGTNRSGAATAGETGPRSASGSAPAPEGKDLGHVVVNRPGHRRNWIRPHRLAGDHRARAAHYPAGLIAALVCRRADDGVDR
jgi:hypothetical protein